MSYLKKIEFDLLCLMLLLIVLLSSCQNNTDETTTNNEVTSTTLVWNKILKDGEVANSIDIDKNGNVYVVGKGYNLVNKNSNDDWLIKKFWPVPSWPENWKDWYAK